MNIIDALKNSVLSQLNYSISITDMVFSLVVAFGISVFINFIYKKTFSGIVFNKNYGLTLTLITLVTAMVIRTINSNLSLSLGMVGALSIVRFRTAIKEPTDTVFLFWGIAAGIMSGAGLYFIGIIASVLVGLLFYVSYTNDVKIKSDYLLVVSYQSAYAYQVEAVLDQISKKQLKSKSTNREGYTEETYEVSLKNTSVIDDLQRTSGVVSVSLITYKNEIGL